MHKWVDGGVEYSVENGALWHDASAVKDVDYPRTVSVLIFEVVRLAAELSSLKDLIAEVYLRSLGPIRGPLE